MSLLRNGRWHVYRNGEFIREEARFRNWITVDGAPGPSGDGGFQPQPGRYHLIVSLACPWAHRTLILRRLKGLEDSITVSVVHPHMGRQGWEFDGYPGSTPDTLYRHRYLYELYARADPDYSGIVTVPVRWDRQRHTIVSNESSEIIRMFNSAFDRWGAAHIDFYPQSLRAQIDPINVFVYENVNNGVYRTGFATSQRAYESAFRSLFSALDTLEARLVHRQYLVGDQLTEADWRLFTTLVRFDAVYYGHFKCNLRRIADYPALSKYLRDLYHYPGVAETVNMDHIKLHYYSSHDGINPGGIVPAGPELDFMKP